MIRSLLNKFILKLKSVFKYMKLNISNFLVLTFKKYLKIFITSTLLKKFIRFFMLLFLNLTIIILSLKYYPSILISKLSFVLNEKEYSDLIDEIFKQCPNKSLLIKSLKNYYYYQYLINSKNELILILVGLSLIYFSIYLLHVTNSIDYDLICYYLLKLPDFEKFVDNINIDLDKGYVEEDYLSEFQYVLSTNKREEEDSWLIFKLVAMFHIWFPIFMSQLEYTISKSISEMEHANMIGLDDFFFILT